MGETLRLYGRMSVGMECFKPMYHCSRENGSEWKRLRWPVYIIISCYQSSLKYPISSKCHYLTLTKVVCDFPKTFFFWLQRESYEKILYVRNIKKSVLKSAWDVTYAIFLYYSIIRETADKFKKWPLLSTLTKRRFLSEKYQAYVCRCTPSGRNR